MRSPLKTPFRSFPLILTENRANTIFRVAISRRILFSQSVSSSSQSGASHCTSTRLKSPTRSKGTMTATNASAACSKAASSVAP